MSTSTIYYIQSIFNCVQYVLLVRAFFFVLFVGLGGEVGGLMYNYTWNFADHYKKTTWCRMNECEEGSVQYFCFPW